jgi:hypothetical protein
VLDDTIGDIYRRISGVEANVAADGAAGAVGATGATGAAGSDAVLDMTEKWQALTVSTPEVWEEVDLSGYGVADGDLVWVLFVISVGGPLDGGARGVGSVLERRADLHGENAVLTLPVVATGAAIEVYVESTTDLTCYLVGYMTLA